MKTDNVKYFNLIFGQNKQETDVLSIEVLHEQPALIWLEDTVLNLKDVFLTAIFFSFLVCHFDIYIAEGVWGWLPAGTFWQTDAAEAVIKESCSK